MSNQCRWCRVHSDAVGVADIGRLIYELEADTTRLNRKLRAIVKHLSALADELEAIDSEGEQEGEQEGEHATDRR